MPTKADLEVQIADLETERFYLKADVKGLEADLEIADATIEQDEHSRIALGDLQDAICAYGDMEAMRWQAIQAGNYAAVNVLTGR